MSTGNSSSASGKRGPPLPPRQSNNINETASSLHDDGPPPYESMANDYPSESSVWASSQDPRASSTQSLPATENPELSGRRRLLLIYIHGFMGNETSFRSFPAHVHNILSVLLAETHVVHSKIYPRYRSKRNISFARDDFSKWLEPHESSSTDIVLLGHSMGGLLSAEVVLMPAVPPAARPLKHRVLGTINLDVPFLGMHPGVVKSGLASIFIPPEAAKNQCLTGDSTSEKQDVASSGQSTIAPPHRTDTLWERQQNDPNFNPSFANDVILPMRDGWKNAFHFMHKHSGDLYQASKKLISSHMEFGGAMANYGELKTRYSRIRGLEVDDPRVRATVIREENSTPPPRVRFVNYYTSCTGRPSRPKTPPPSTSEVNRENAESSVATGSSAEQLSNDYPAFVNNGDGSNSQLPPEISDIDHDDLVNAAESLTIGGNDNSKTNNPEKQQEKKELTHHEKETLRLEQEKRRMEAEARRLRGETSPERSKPTEDRNEVAAAAPVAQENVGTPFVPPETEASESSDQSKKTKKSPKERTFCVLPPKDSNGQRDPCWIRVLMEGVDEVGAHCGLFFVDEGYERLVGDVAERIENWVKEDYGDSIAA